MKEKCKWCAEEGVCGFGWLDNKGEWNGLHFTCLNHVAISAAKQDLECSFERLRERSRSFSKQGPLYFQSNL